MKSLRVVLREALMPAPVLHIANPNVPGSVVTETSSRPEEIPAGTEGVAHSIQAIYNGPAAEPVSYLVQFQDAQGVWDPMWVSKDLLKFPDGFLSEEPTV